MPCAVESQDGGVSWFCCNCSDGPNSWQLNFACPSCNNHNKCDFGVIPLTPPPDPPVSKSTDTPKVKAKGVSRDVSLPSSPQDSTASGPSSNNDVVPQQEPDDSVASLPENNSEAACDERWQLLDVALERETKTILRYQFALASLDNGLSTSSYRSCPSGDKRKRSAKNAPSSLGLDRSDRKPGQDKGRKKSTNRRLKQDSDDEDSEQKEGKEDPKRQNTPDGNFACLFCKFNPHRYRHRGSCCRGFTRSRLWEHLERVHELHECISCLEIFPDEEYLDENRSCGRQCQWKDFEHPAEGIGSRIMSEVDRQNAGPKGSDSHQKNIDWWKDLYRRLFGAEAYSRLSSCFYDADEITQSNDIHRRDEFRDLHLKTLRRGLPREQLEVVVRNYFVSFIEAEGQFLRNMLGNAREFEQARAVLSLPKDVVRSRRKSREKGTTKAEEAHEGTDLSPSEQPSSDILDEFLTSLKDIIHTDNVSEYYEVKQGPSAPAQGANHGTIPELMKYESNVLQKDTEDIVDMRHAALASNEQIDHASSYIAANTMQLSEPLPLASHQVYPSIPTDTQFSNTSLTFDVPHIPMEMQPHLFHPSSNATTFSSPVVWGPSNTQPTNTFQPDQNNFIMDNSFAWPTMDQFPPLVPMEEVARPTLYSDSYPANTPDIRIGLVPAQVTDPTLTVPSASTQRKVRQGTRDRRPPKRPRCLDPDRETPLLMGSFETSFEESQVSMGGAYHLLSGPSRANVPSGDPGIETMDDDLDLDLFDDAWS